MAFRFATEFRVLGNSGSGGGLDDVEVVAVAGALEVGVALLPLVSPAER